MVFAFPPVLSRRRVTIVTKFFCTDTEPQHGPHMFGSGWRRVLTWDRSPGTMPTRRSHYGHLDDRRAHHRERFAVDRDKFSVVAPTDERYRIGARREVTLLSRLFGLVAVALVPAIALQMYNEFDLRRARQAEVQNQALSLATLAAAEQQQIVQGIRQVLIAISELPSIKTRNNQACNAYLAAMQQRFPAFITFLVADLNGWSFCDTNSDHRPITIAARGYFANVLKTGAFTVGEFSAGLSTGRNVVQFALPFYGDHGRMGGVIVAGLNLDWLADYIARKGVPEGAALAITDRNGIYLARYPHNDRVVGTKMPGEKYLKMDDRGAVDILNVDGVERIEGYSALGADSGGLVVSFGLDKAQAFTEIQNRTQRGILLIALSTSLVLVLTSLGARRFIHRPLGQLVDAANQWRLGEVAPRLDIRGKAELA